MQVCDLDGKPVTVTDLAKAIKQASMFMDFRHIDPFFAQVDKCLQACAICMISKSTSERAEGAAQTSVIERVAYRNGVPQKTAPEPFRLINNGAGQ